MNPDEQRLEMILRYLRDELNEEDREQVEYQMKIDPSFRAEVEDYRFLIQGLQSLHGEKILGSIQNWETSHRTSSRQRKSPPPVEEPPKPKQDDNAVFPTIRTLRYYAVAAVILILILPLGYMLYQIITDNPTNNELFTANFEPYEDWQDAPRGPLPPEWTSEDSLKHMIKDSLRQTGLKYYNAGAYKEAIEHLQQYLEVSTAEGDPQEQFYLGVALLANEQAVEAEIPLVSARYEESGLFAEQSEWYLALTYLKLGDSHKLRETLDAIIEKEDHSFRKKAKKLKKMVW